MIDPISAVAINPTSLNQPTTQNLADSSSLSTSWASGPDVLTVRATDMAPSQSSNPLTSESFENMAQQVHEGVKFSGPNKTQNPMQVDNDIVKENIKTLSPEFDSSGNKTVNDPAVYNPQDSINILKKTFQHATFSAMVTQVATGISGSIRMLAKQS